MSLHNRPEFNTPGIVDGLKLHGMRHDTPSQLADAFRQGYVYAMTPPCEHDWVSMRNKAVESGEYCPKCGGVRSESTTTSEGER